MLLSLLSDVNWLAVLAATVAVAVLGGLYFGLLVPAAYNTALGRPRDAKPAMTLLSGLGPVVGTLITVVTSAVLLRALGVTTVSGALGFGAVVGVGYLSAMTFVIAINPNFPRPLRYGVLNAPYFLVGSLLTAVILTALA